MSGLSHKLKYTYILNIKFANSILNMAVVQWIPILILDDLYIMKLVSDTTPNWLIDLIPKCTSKIVIKMLQPVTYTTLNSFVLCYYIKPRNIIYTSRLPYYTKHIKPYLNFFAKTHMLMSLRQTWNLRVRVWIFRYSLF